MSDGIRIRPRLELGFPDGALVVVTDHARPFPAPADGQKLEDVIAVCATCGVQHFAKNYHLQLRGGTVIVSTTIWENLRGLADNPFELANPVPEPPVQKLVLPPVGIFMSAGEPGKASNGNGQVR